MPFATYIYYVRLRMLDNAGDQEMSDATIAADLLGEEQSREAHDFVELGRVSEETKGDFVGQFYDGGFGRFQV